MKSNKTDSRELFFRLFKTYLIQCGIWSFSLAAAFFLLNQTIHLVLKAFVPNYHLIYRSLYLGIFLLIFWGFGMIYFTYRLLRSHVRQTSEQALKLEKEMEQQTNDLLLYLAHDLKTPLSSLMGYLTLLHDKTELPEASREKYLAICLDKAQRLEDFINEFFEIATLRLSDVSLQCKTIDLTLLLEQNVYEFQPVLTEKNLRCSLDLPETLLLYCDADKLRRVFDNLLSNAVNYSFHDTEITITAKAVPPNVLITFSNHGSTVSAEHLEHLFEQFYRLDTSRSTVSTGAGAGLGLAIAKQILTLHNGTITAQSHDGQTVFTITLPLS